MDSIEKIEKIIAKNDELMKNPMEKLDSINTNVPSLNTIENEEKPSEFVNAVDKVKLNILQDAGTNDEKFIKEVKDNVKDATLKLTEAEKESAELKKQNIIYKQELQDKDKKLNDYKKLEDLWANKEKKRLYHYNGVKPIMEFVGIKEPMNLIFLYSLTIILVWFFLLAKLFKGTIGALIAGAEDSNRPKAIKGLLWTMVAVFIGTLLTAVAIAILKWCNVI